MKKLLLILIFALIATMAFSQTKARTGLIVGDERVSGTNIAKIDSVTKYNDTWIMWNGGDTLGIYTPVSDRVDFDEEITDLIKADSIALVGDAVAFFTGADTTNVYIPYEYRDYLDDAFIDFNTPTNTGNIVAATGITSTMLTSVLVYNGTSAIDITSNPQIVDGTSGQIITIIGLDDSNTLTLDDGSGLQLAGGASMVLGIGDIIKLIYVSSLDLWVEISRSNN